MPDVVPSEGTGPQDSRDGGRFPGVLGDLQDASVGIRPQPVALSGGGLGPGVGGSPKWAKILDQTRCIGCHACTTACKSENEVPLGVDRTYVKYVDVGSFPQARRAFQVTRCNQCENAPCVAACPTSAMYQREDGIVDFDKSICIGCKACIAACPYDAIFINPEDQSAEKCNFCTHRLEVGLEPACVVVCPTEAILVGDMNDPASRVSQNVNREPVNVRRPEKETRPKVFYKGAHQTTLDPLAARRPQGDTYMWSEQPAAAGHVVPSGQPPAWNKSSAAAVLAYDVAHEAPWDWRVSLYTWTKGIATGVYLVPLLLVLAALMDWSNELFLWASPMAGGLFLAITGALLIWDLEHPERFYMIFTRPQWRSWLVKGAVMIAGYGAVLGLHFLASLADNEGLRKAVAVPGVAFAVMAAVYTAYLFVQSKGRDLWQNPLLAPHMVVQSALAGSATLLLLTPWVDTPATEALRWTLTVSALVHLMFVWGEHTLVHPTAHARLAAWEMTHGRYRVFFWPAVAMVTIGLLAPVIGAWAAAPALLGLLAHEHAYVQGGQAVPLA
jgi:Fe-S-cluster-containing dehydrogenase component/formate-dependent nitrite reductase membrane component NrfD